MSEKNYNSMGDYGNEPNHLIMKLNLILHKKKEGTFDSYFYEGIDSVKDDELRDVIVEARETLRLRTIEERYPELFIGKPVEDATGLERAEWIRQNPERAAEINRCAEVMNTTLDVPEFKQAANDMNLAIYGYHRPIFVVPNPLYADEPRLRNNLVGDYRNEPLGLMMSVADEMVKRGVPKTYIQNNEVIDVDNQMLQDIVTELRAKAANEPQTGPRAKTTLIRTLHDRYLKPFYDAGEPLSDEVLKAKIWIEESPVRMPRFDECVEIINTSNDMDAFKRAMNDIHEIMEMKPAFVIPVAFPKRPGAAAVMLSRLPPGPSH